MLAPQILVIFLLRLVYPNKSLEMLATCTIEELMNEPEVEKLLGSIVRVDEACPEQFYHAVQWFVDSKDKVMHNKEQAQIIPMAYWPLIKVVRIYTKADVLSTGAVIVDLPGIQDSNTARAVVARNYMKQCSGKHGTV